MNKIYMKAFNILQYDCEGMTVLSGELSNTHLVLVRHNEPEGSARVGALPEDGNIL